MAASETDGGATGASQEAEPASVIWRRHERRARKLMRAAAGMAAAIAAFALGGALIGRPELVQRGEASMGVSEASAALLVVAALWGAATRAPRLRAAAAIAALAAAAIAALAAAGLAPRLSGESAPSGAAAAALFLLGAGAARILFVSARPAPLTSWLCGGGAALIAADGLVGHLLGPGPLLVGRGGGGLSVAGALVTGALAGAFVLTQPRAGLGAALLRPDVAGMIARRLLPPAILAPLAFTWLRGAGERAGLFDERVGVALGGLAIALALVTFVLLGARHAAEAFHRRLRATESAAESEARLRLLLESLREHGVVRLAPDGRIAGFTSAAERITGFSADEVLGRSFTLLHTKADVDGARPQRRLERAARDGALEEDGARVRKGGGTFLANAVLAAIRAPDGHLVGFVEVLRDITARRRAEDERARRDVERNERREVARRGGEARARARAAALAREARSLREALAAVGETARIDAEAPLSDRGRERVESAATSAEAFLLRADDLAFQGAIEEGRIEISPARFNARQVFHQALRAFAPRAHAKEVELVLDVRPSVPDELVGDAVRLQQILVNLLANAVDASDRGEVVLTAEASPADDKVRLRIVVRDSGPGIPADRQALVEACLRPTKGETSAKPEADAQPETGAGPEEKELDGGLGLRVAARLTERLGGALRVRNAPGGGATAELSILCAALPGAPVTRAPEALDPRARVLVVDDRSRSRDALVALLGGTGAQAAAAGGGEAVALARSWAAHDEPFEVAVVDAQLGTDLGALTFALATEVEPAPALVLLARVGQFPVLPPAVSAVRLTKPASADALRAAIARAAADAMTASLARGADAAPHPAGTATAHPAFEDRVAEVTDGSTDESTVVASDATASREDPAAAASSQAAEELGAGPWAPFATRGEAASLDHEAAAAGSAGASSVEGAQEPEPVEATAVTSAEEAIDALGLSAGPALERLEAAHEAADEAADEAVDARHEAMHALSSAALADDATAGLHLPAGGNGASFEDLAFGSGSPQSGAPLDELAGALTAPMGGDAAATEPTRRDGRTSAEPASSAEPPPSAEDAPSAEQAASALGGLELLLDSTAAPDAAATDTTAAASAEPTEPPAALAESPAAPSTEPTRADHPARPAPAPFPAGLTPPMRARRVTELTVQVSLGAISSFDPQTVMRQVGGDQELLAAFARDCAREHEVLFEMLAQAVAGRDAPRIAELAHRLTGSLQALAATPAAQLAVAIEEAAGRRELAGSALKLPRLEAELLRLEAELGAFSSAPS